MIPLMFPLCFCLITYLNMCCIHWESHIVDGCRVKICSTVSANSQLTTILNKEQLYCQTSCFFYQDRDTTTVYRFQLTQQYNTCTYKHRFLLDYLVMQTLYFYCLPHSWCDERFPCVCVERFVGMITQKLLNWFPPSFDGGWVSGRTQPQ